MQKFIQKQFNIGELEGISAKNIQEHLKLYAGYVNSSNLILKKLEEYKEEESKSYEKSELQRRFAFEFGGMRNHEYYFSSLEGGAKESPADSALKAKITEQFGSYEEWLAYFKKLAGTRGVGWAILYYDKQTDRLLNQWVDEQHLGHLVSATPVLALDMWEHAFVYDYATSEKGNYIEAFFANLNWEKIEQNFTEAKK